jgi:DNA-binding response OmpR family regulator
MKRVLFVEDDAFIRDIASVKLSDNGFEVIVAENGEEARAKLQEELPDIVLLDLDLPDISGLELLKEMKNDAMQKAIPVIIFSNSDEPNIQQQSIDVGAVDFFVKASTDMGDLMESIRKHTA